jgi:GntR family transcriptional regulator/MocR family aminotransferase
MRTSGVVPFRWLRRATLATNPPAAINRNRAEPLSLQIVRHLQEAIETGSVAGGTQLPSTHSLARTLGVSRNTVLTAYDELAARGFVRGRRGAGMYVFVPTTVTGFDLRSVMRDA